MFDGKGGQVGIGCEIGAGSKVIEELSQDLPMIRTRLDEPHSREYEPGIDNSCRVVHGDWPWHYPRTGGEAKKRQDHNPRKPYRFVGIESVPQPFSRRFVMRRTRVDRVDEQIDVYDFHFFTCNLRWISSSSMTSTSRRPRSRSIFGGCPRSNVGMRYGSCGAFAPAIPRRSVSFTISLNLPKMDRLHATADVGIHERYLKKLGFREIDGRPGVFAKAL